MKNGVPWDTAFSLDDVEATAFGIMCWEWKGGKFNYETMDWEAQG